MKVLFLMLAIKHYIGGLGVIYRHFELQHSLVVAKIA